jgi:hypothetical protein
MDTPRIPEISYENLVDDVIERFEPAKRLWSVRSRLLLWLALELALMALVAYRSPRPDLPLKIHNLQYLFELTAFIALGALSAGLALRTAIPGREVTTNELTLVSVIAFLAVLMVSSEPATREGTLGAFLLTGIRCGGCTVLLAALPWCALFLAVRRGVPLATEKAGALIGAAAFSFAFAATRMGCRIDDSMHLLVWHVFPIAVGTVLSVVLAMAWLRARTFR